MISRILKALVCALPLISAPSAAFADYLVGSPIQAIICHGFISQTCESKRVDATFEDGKPQDLPAIYETADRHAGGICWIEIDSNIFKNLLGCGCNFAGKGNRPKLIIMGSN
ncbi:hypothetical protein ABLO27_12775 [Roseibium sp. SCPC15]|uniref:hypothetical protein n=1 Tax=Roseibium sp. SCP15 TaxID=3141376 RepID=UPI00333645E9